MSQVNLVKNYITNVDEILDLVKKEEDNFSLRNPSTSYNFATAYGNSNMKSLFHFHMSKKLIDAIFKTLPVDDKVPYPDSIVINRYDPGDFLPRHKDSIGAYWKFKLIYLQADKPHFRWFSKDNQGHFVNEEPGALLQMPIDLEHEVTEIGKDERPKYSLVLAWGM